MLKNLLAVLSVSFFISGCMGSDGAGLVAATRAPTLYPWMNPEIADAWKQGYLGQGAQVTVVDNFSSDTFSSGDLGTGRLFQRHGDWVALQARMIAPAAWVVERDFNSEDPVSLASGRLNIMNLSYGVSVGSSVDVASIGWSEQEQSLIDHAFAGSAVVVKSAGNNAIALDSSIGGRIDGLSIALIGADAAIFVGALNKNGTVIDQASLASYSNFAGTTAAVQNQFLSVGVTSNLMGGLAGTSFAAPIVSGYAAVLGSKFPTANPTQIATQLLDTARTDTIANYNVELHGRGEASITRALAPSSIQ